MKLQDYQRLRETIIDLGYGEEVVWAQTVGPPADAWVFFCEYAWVVLNSGMKNQVAEGIWEKVKKALADGLPVRAGFGHPGKAQAIQDAYDNRETLFREYLAAPDKLAHLQRLPWIGPITKWHLAKNFGHDCCKPDRHLERLGREYGLRPDVLCSQLAEKSGDRIGTVDLVLWRSVNLGLI